MSRFKWGGSRFTRFHGGVSPKHAKHTQDCAIRQMPVPKQVIIPMGQHIGAPCVPIVKPGDLVKKGQVIGAAEAFLCSPIHATTSGKVKSVGPFAAANGARLTAIVIDADGEDAWDETLQAPVINSYEDFLEAVRQSGLVGLGGAGFPAHVKLKAPADHPFEMLVVNAAECEPYLTVDYRAMIEQTADLIEGIKAVNHWLKVPRVIIGIEDNKPLAIKQVREAAQAAGLADRVEVVALPSRYPQGAEKTLIYATTGRRVPAGGLPAHVGCVVMNVTSLIFLGSYLQTGRPLVAKNLTVDGDAIHEPQNIRALIGTPIREVAAFCGGLDQEPTSVLMGGPMMGIAIPDLDQPILKNNNGILFLTDQVLHHSEETDCIRCARCVTHCPMNLMPKKIMDTVKYKHYDRMESTGVLNCIECGSCAYECPAHIPLVHYMKFGKDIIRKGRR